MDKLKVAKQIKTFSIIGLVAIPIFVICLVLSTVLVVNGSYVLPIVLNAGAVIFILVAAILDLVASIRVLATDWGNEQLNNDKTLWGILGLIILPTIAPLIFSCKATKVLSA